MAYAWDVMDLPADDGGWSTGGGGWDMGTVDAGGGSIWDGISGFFDGAWNATAGVLGTYMDFENWKFDKSMQQAQQQAELQRLNAQTQKLYGGGGSGSLSTGTLLTVGLFVVGGLLIWKVVK